VSLSDKLFNSVINIENSVARRVALFFSTIVFVVVAFFGCIIELAFNCVCAIIKEIAEYYKQVKPGLSGLLRSISSCW
jgi:hypothetical protein